MSDYFEREPIFWTSTKPGYNDKDRQRVRFEAGRKIIERVPQRGHQGDYENRRPARGVRSIRVVRHDGHVVDSVLTSGAAHLDPSTPQGQYIQAKWRYFGWYPLGSCPLALVAMGQIQRDHLHADFGDAPPCAHGKASEQDPCPHALAELEARRRSRASESAQVERTFADKEQRILDAQRDNTRELGEMLRDVIREVRAGHVHPALAGDDDAGDPRMTDPKIAHLEQENAELMRRLAAFEASTVASKQEADTRPEADTKPEKPSKKDR